MAAISSANIRPGTYEDIVCALFDGGTAPMRLADMMGKLDVIRVRGEPAQHVAGNVTCNSRDVNPGDVFVCIRGVHNDGHRFIREALRRGAGALIVDEHYTLMPRTAPAGRVAEAPRRMSKPISRTSSHDRRPAGAPDRHPSTSDRQHSAPSRRWRQRAPVIQVRDTRLAYAQLCAAAAGYPARDLHLTGITGTNGKTSTALFIDAIYRTAGFKTGLVSTVFSRIGDETLPQRLTTPEAGDLQRTLSQMRSRQVNRGVLEISSHALSMHRVAECPLQAAVFTNLTRDHLDYHGSWDDYRRSKGRIFSLLDRDNGVAIVNADDATGRRFARDATYRVVTYSLRRDADVRGTLIAPGAMDTRGTVDAMNTVDVQTMTHDSAVNATRLHIETPDGLVTAPLNTPGICNAYNALAAAAAAWAQGIELDAIAAGIRRTRLPPGRFQQITAGQPFRVYVDFAHNPTGLANALLTVRTGLRGKLRLVFGCKGDDGDALKRRLMGRIAARYADEIVVTTDNPQEECPRHIATVVAQGIAEAGFPSERYTIIPDRAEAIRVTLNAAQPADAVLLAGRGHEREQRFGDDVVALDDAAVATELLHARYGL